MEVDAVSVTDPGSPPAAELELQVGNKRVRSSSSPSGALSITSEEQRLFELIIATIERSGSGTVARVAGG